MRTIRCACACGATLHMFDEDEGLCAGVEAAWRAAHTGPGHDETDYISAGQERVRKEKARLREQIATSKHQGGN